MRALALALLLVGATAGALPAATYHLDAAGTGDFPTIASGIALCSPGDTLLLAAGLYLGAGNTQLDYGGKDIVIAGAGPGATILDCEDSGQAAVLFQRGETRAAVLRDLTLRNNRGSYWPTGVTILATSPTLANLHLEDFDGYWSENWPPYYRGPALHCEDASPRVEDVVVRGCNYAGGAYLIGGAPEFERVLVENCGTNLCSGGGIYVEGGARFHEVVVRNCNAYGGSGGGICCSGAVAAVFENCRFEGNEQGTELGFPFAGGGGFACYGSAPIIRQSVFLDCEARDGGGGLLASDGAAPVLEDVLFADCGSGAGGSAISLRSSTASLQGVTIAGCRLWMGGHEANARSAILSFDSIAELERVIVTNSSIGTGLWIDATSIANVSCSDFYANPDGNYGGTLADQTGLNGNISADPLFCGEAICQEAYTLAVSSPCAPAGNDCGVLMGARPLGCADIGGVVVDAEGQPISEVAILGSPATANTNDEGVYLIREALGWTGSLSPFLAGYAFTPPQRSYVDLQADAGAQDYLGTRVTAIHVPSEQPNIQAAIALVADGDSILVAPGTYSGGGFRDISLLGKDVRIIGGGSANTTLDCAGSGRAFQVNQGESSLALIQGFRIVNGFVQGWTGQGGGLRVSGASPTLRDLVIRGCVASDRGGGIYLDDSASLLEDIVVADCGDRIDFDSYGGGIACRLGMPTLRRVLLAGNEAAHDGGGLYCWGSSAQLEQVTLVGNTASAGSGVGCDEGATPSLFGCLVTSNYAPFGAVYCRDSASLPAIACTDVFANPGGDYGGTLADQTGLNGNISADPFFCDAAGGDYGLEGSSPCLPANNDCHVQMGAYGEGCDLTAAEDPLPEAFAFAPPQPNPFNPKTSLRFALPHAAAVSLTIFDAQGRRVARLLTGEPLPAGHHAVDWDGRDEAGRALASGVYFARFAAAGFTEEQKLVMLR